MLSAQTLSLAQLIRQAALEELLPRHGQLRTEEVHLHSDGTLFTAADIANEKRLVEGAKIICPHARATGEEEISEDPHEFLREALQQDVIIFDAIDGTGAFKRGEDTYGVMAAYISKGVTLAAAIYTPGHAIKNQDGTFRPEKDLMILAEKGKGCFVNGVKTTLTNRPTSLTEKARIAFACRNQDKEAESILAIGVPGYMERNNSSHDYTRILLGESDATFYSEGFMPLTGQGKCPRGIMPQAFWRFRRQAAMLHYLTHKTTAWHTTPSYAMIACLFAPTRTYFAMSCNTYAPVHRT